MNKSIVNVVQRAKLLASFGKSSYSLETNSLIVTQQRIQIEHTFLFVSQLKGSLMY